MDSMSNTLANKDLAPTTDDQRTWNSWHIAALWVGMAVCIPTYMLAAGMVSQGMNWWQAVLTVMLGNCIVLIPMILNGHGGTKYGVPFPVLVRASFGTVGAHIPSIARALVACGWFGIQCWIGGAAIYSILDALGWINAADDTTLLPVLGITAIQFGCFIAFWLVHVAIIVAGIESIKWLESFAAPFLIAAGLALLLWAILSVDSASDLFRSESSFQTSGEFWKVFFPQLTAMVGFWATLSLNIPDFTRYCKSQRAQATGQLIGLPPTMTLFCFIGVVVTGATVVIFGDAIWDPVELVSRMGSPELVVGSMLALLLATLSTNLAANVVSPANGFSNVSPRLISFRTGALATCAIGVLIMPWRLMNDLGGYIFTWLIGYSALLGPIAGIMLCDYFILRRTRLNRDALYDTRGEYRGVHWRAMVALALAVAPNVPGFVNAATNTAGTDQAYFPPVFDSIYAYAWFVGLFLAIAIYALLGLGSVKPASHEASARPDPDITPRPDSPEH